jgi:hypothetical protein
MIVKALDKYQTLGELCRATKKWGMMISISPDFEETGWIEEVMKAAPYLTTNNLRLILDCFGYILFDTEEEMEKAFWQTVGGDGPTKTNSYNGTCKIYALTCNPEGQTLNENT